MSAALLQCREEKEAAIAEEKHWKHQAEIADLKWRARAFNWIGIVVGLCVLVFLTKNSMMSTKY